MLDDLSKPTLAHLHLGGWRTPQIHPLTFSIYSQTDLPVESLEDLSKRCTSAPQRERFLHQAHPL